MKVVEASLLSVTKFAIADVSWPWKSGSYGQMRSVSRFHSNLSGLLQVSSSSDSCSFTSLVSLEEYQGDSSYFCVLSCQAKALSRKQQYCHS